MPRLVQHKSERYVTGKGSIHVIEVPSKHWRPKQVNKYIPVEYAEDIDDGVFDYEHYGKTMYRPKKLWKDGIRDDIILYDRAEHEDEMLKGLKIGKTVTDTTKLALIGLITKYWDCFVEEGARRPIIGYEFAIETGLSKPVCCKKPNYGPYESEIIMKQIVSLIKNDWIEECEGPWGSMIVLAAKPHQEGITDIAKFIWRMCVSYRKLNSVTKPFEYPIPRCDDAVTIVMVGSTVMWIITVDARQGYHQVAVRRIDREKLAFFAPDHKKYTFKVMPFGPTNAPPFYTAMMGDFQREWSQLFIEKISAMETIGGELIVVHEDKRIEIGSKILHNGSRVIIDDVLLWSSNLPAILLMFECICIVFRKYRVSFRLDKCDFLKERVEYVGHDLTARGNCPAQSKFDLINDWPLPRTGQALHSFIGLLNFYHHYKPQLELRMKPLRELYKRFYRSDIPIMGWTPKLIQLFEDLKIGITSSPVLSRFDPSKPTILKTDWCARGMSWILMQPADDDLSIAATKLLLKTGEFLFDLEMDGPRLKPVKYGSRACTTSEKWFHSFVGEAAAGRWGIGQNRKFLWGNQFYWVCDCAAVKEVLDYEGPISMIKRWAQELLGYHFTVIHRSAKMMKDVDSLNRFYEPEVAEFLKVAAILRSDDAKKRPDAYDRSNFKTVALVTKMNRGDAKDPTSDPPLIITDDDIRNSTPFATARYGFELEESTEKSIVTSPVMVCQPVQDFSARSSTISGDKESPMFQAVENMKVHWLCINDITGSTSTWADTEASPPLIWLVQNVFTSESNAKLFTNMLPLLKWQKLSFAQLISDSSSLSAIHGIDSTFIPTDEAREVMEWIRIMMKLIEKFITKFDTFNQGLFWIPQVFMSEMDLSSCETFMKNNTPRNWQFHISRYNSAAFEDAVAAKRICIHLWSEYNGTEAGKTNEGSFSEPQGFAQCIQDNVQIPHDTEYIDVSTAMNDHSDENQCFTCPRVVAVTTDQSTTLSSVWGPNAILDPAFPAVEPTITFNQGNFGKRFGIPVSDGAKGWHARAQTTLELFRTYSIPEDLLGNPSLLFGMDTVVDKLLPFSTPFRLKSCIMDSAQKVSSLEDMFVHGEIEQATTVQCYHVTSATKPTESLDWKLEYGKDVDTSIVMNALASHKPQNVPSDVIKTIKAPYKALVKAGSVVLINERLVYYKPIMDNHRCIGLIIVPEGLRRKLFNHYHAGPSGGHMGEYKTLYRMRNRFFWPSIRENIKQWVAGCAHCLSYNSWRSRRSELHFTWPVTVPFWIIHVDLWSPGTAVTNKQGDTGYLMNSMCDLTQFVVSTITFDITSHALAKLFMADVILSFGMCAIVVIDDGSTFKGHFTLMCEALKIQYWILSRGNHKGNSCERYHRFLNKTQTIHGNDRGTHNVFLQNAKTSQFAWNSAPIDNTDVVRSLAAVGREFRFPLDVELSVIPPINDASNSALTNYLRDVSIEAKFATSVVQVLIEERRLAHQERVNKDKVVSSLQVGDIVKAHVQVQSKQELGVVGKLSYRARGPFRIVKVLGHNSFEVQNWTNPAAATRKYKATELYLLPPSLFPSEPLDTLDQRYLNYENAPVVSPLRKPLRIELYNDVHFHPKPPTSSKSVDKPSSALDKAAFQQHQVASIPTVEEMHTSTNTISTQQPIEDEIVPTLPTTSQIATKIAKSKNKLFFIKFTPDGTLRERWYLIQIDMDSTKSLNANFVDNGQYFGSFLAKHPNDSKKSDEFSRWWPDWYEYTTCAKTGIIIYGDRILFRPGQLPDSEKYVQWAQEVNLTDTRDNFLAGPFEFSAINEQQRTRNIVDGLQWQQLLELCNTWKLTPPTLGSQNRINNSGKIQKKNTKKRKKI